MYRYHHQGIPNFVTEEITQSLRLVSEPKVGIAFEFGGDQKAVLPLRSINQGAYALACGVTNLGVVGSSIHQTLQRAGCNSSYPQTKS